MNKLVKIYNNNRNNIKNENIIVYNFYDISLCVLWNYFTFIFLRYIKYQISIIIILKIHINIK